MDDDKKTQTPPPVPPRVNPVVKIIKHSDDQGEQMVTKPITLEQKNRPKSD